MPAYGVPVYDIGLIVQLGARERRWAFNDASDPHLETRNKRSSMIQTLFSDVDQTILTKS